MTTHHMRVAVPYETWVTYALKQAEKPLTVDEISASVRATYKRTIAAAQIRAFLSMNGIFRRSPSSGTAPSGEKWYLAGSNAEETAKTSAPESLYNLKDLPPPSVVAEGEYDRGVALVGGDSTDARAVRGAVEVLRAKGVSAVRLLVGHRAGDLASRMQFEGVSVSRLPHPPAGLDYRRAVSSLYRNGLKGVSCLCLVGSGATLEETVLVNLAETLDIPCHLQK